MCNALYAKVASLKRICHSIVSKNMSKAQLNRFTLRSDPTA